MRNLSDQALIDEVVLRAWPDFWLALSETLPATDGASDQRERDIQWLIYRPFLASVTVSVFWALQRITQDTTIHLSTELLEPLWAAFQTSVPELMHDTGVDDILWVTYAFNKIFAALRAVVQTSDGISTEIDRVTTVFEV